MREPSFRRLALFSFTGWTFWVVGNVIISHTGKVMLTSQAFAASENKAEGLGVYRQFCLNCHGVNGKGDDNMKKVMTSIPDFTSEKWQKEVSDPQMSVSITDGKGTLMPAFADKVKADQVQALVEYIREFDPARVK